MARINGAPGPRQGASATRQCGARVARVRPSFDAASPCTAGEHPMLPLERRLGRVLELIEKR